jgi:hypothetical protein
MGLMNAIVCSSIKHKNKTAAPEADHELTATVQYQKYHTAMGMGKGMIFHLNFVTQHVIHLDSVVIGGKSMSFSLVSSKPLKYEINYTVNKAEPSVEQPNPKMKYDPIIDDKLFQPSWAWIQLDGKSLRIPLVIFTELP